MEPKGPSSQGELLSLLINQILFHCYSVLQSLLLSECFKMPFYNSFLLHYFLMLRMSLICVEAL